MFRVKMALLSLLMPALVAGVVFGAAGRFDLPGVWTLLGVLAIFCLVIAATADPDLMRERVTPGEGNRDRLTRPLGSLLLLAHWILAGLDARFGWTPIPLEVQLTGAAAYAAAMAFMLWTLRVNRFYSSVVRVQTDRGHHLIDTGPYRFVRHPGYAATLVGVFAGGLALGSWLALLPLVACAGLFVRRVLIEEELLRAELPGYAEYAQRVRSRLIAGVF